MSAANLALIRRFFAEVVNGGDMALLDECYAVNAVDRNVFRGQAPGPAGIRAALIELRTAFPNLHVIVEEMRAEADTVITRETWQGTHATTGNQVTGTVTHIFRIQDGKIAEEWSGGWEWLDRLGDD